MIISHKIGQLKVGAHTKNYVTKGDYYNAELAGQNLLFLFYVFCFVFVLFLFCFYICIKEISSLIRAVYQIDHFPGGTVRYNKYG